MIGAVEWRRRLLRPYVGDPAWIVGVSDGVVVVVDGYVFLGRREREKEDQRAETSWLPAHR